MNRQMTVLIRKETKELFFSAKGLLFFLLMTIVLSAFSLMLVTNTELSLLDNAEALYMMCGVVLGMLMLISAVYGSDAIAGERERHTLDTLLVTPLSLRNIVEAKLLFSMMFYCLLYLPSIPYFFAVGSSGQNLGQGIVYLFILGLMLSLIYTALGIYVSMRVKSYKAALTVNLVIILFSASPLLLSASLRQSSLGKAFDYLNPFADALNTLDAVIIDSEPLSMQLIRIGAIAVITFVVTGVTIIRARKVLP